MSHEVHNGDCHAVLVTESGELKLVCRHTLKELTHGPSLKLIKLNYDAKTKHGRAEVSVAEKHLPVICANDKSFELRGGLVKSLPCDCGEVTEEGHD